MNDNIFVYVISFNEEELLLTVEDAYAKAHEPEKLFFGIYEQRTDYNFVDLSSYKNVKKVESQYKYPRGTGIARMNAFMLNNGEHYCMYIDSHTLFKQDWDLMVKEQFKELKQQYDKPFISHVLQGWRRDKNNSIEILEDWNPSTLIAVVARRYQGLYYEMSWESFDRSLRFKEHYLCSGMYAFGEMKAFKECMPDPRTFFYGEEQLLAIRLSTRGWKIFACNESLMLSKGVTIKDWVKSDFWRSIARDLEFQTLFEHSDLEIANYPEKGASFEILSGAELGYWGAPDQESYEEYIDNLNFDYRDLKKMWYNQNNKGDKDAIESV
jgi:hypothetical protein